MIYDTITITIIMFLSWLLLVPVHCDTYSLNDMRVQTMTNFWYKSQCIVGQIFKNVLANIMKHVNLPAYVNQIFQRETAADWSRISGDTEGITLPLDGSRSTPVNKSQCVHSDTLLIMRTMIHTYCSPNTHSFNRQMFCTWDWEHHHLHYIRSIRWVTLYIFQFQYSWKAILIASF